MKPLDEFKINVRKDIISLLMKSLNKSLSNVNKEFIDGVREQTNLTDDQIQMNLYYKILFEVSCSFVNSVPEDLVKVYMLAEKLKTNKKKEKERNEFEEDEENNNYDN